MKETNHKKQEEEDSIMKMAITKKNLVAFVLTILLAISYVHCRIISDENISGTDVLQIIFFHTQFHPFHKVCVGLLIYIE